MSENAEEIVQRTAALAGLSIPREEAERLGPQFASILEAFRELATLEREPGAPSADAGAHGPAAPPRADEPRPSLPRELLLGSAPESEDGFFRVPKTVGDPGAAEGRG